MTELAGRIDPFELDLLERAAGGVDEHGLAEGHDTLLDTGYGALEKNEVVLDLAVANETAHSVKLLACWRILERRSQHTV